jgi:sugar lactone lactonase YvrE
LKHRWPAGSIYSGTVVARSLVLIAVVASCSDPVPVSPDAHGDAPQVGCTLPSTTLAVATLAGCDEDGMVDGARAVARFANPVNVVIASSTVTYVADFDNGRIRAVELGGATRTVVSRPDFKVPFGLALAANGMLYVETDDNDAGMHSETTGTIWRVDPDTGDATVIARDLGRPRGLAVLPDGRIAMADHHHHVLSILDPATGAVTPLAGTIDQVGYTNATGALARFAQPYDLVVLPGGDLVVSELDNHRLRRVTLAGVVTDFAGTGVAGGTDGPIETATFNGPQGLAISGSTLYVTDIKSHTIRRIANGMVTTIAGDGTAGWQDADAPLTAKFYGLEGIDVRGNRLVAADGNIGDGATFNRVRTVDLSKVP